MGQSNSKSFPDNAPKKNIFLSYRKKDTESITGRLFDTLTNHFSDDQIFMDMDKLEPGVDFEEVITKRLDDCDVMLAIIGPDWLGKNPDGTSRIMNEKDWVRLELGTALKRKIRVIPVTVEGASLPTEDQLPEDLQSLVRKQKYEVTNNRWDYDTGQLILFMHKLMGTSPAVKETVQTAASKPSSVWTKRSTWGFVALGMVLLFVLLLLIPNDSNTESEALVNDANTTTGATTENSADGNNEQGSFAAGDIQGHWSNLQNPDTSSYYTIIQDETELMIKQVVNGYEEGSGKGIIKGQEVEFVLKTTKSGETRTKATISADGTELKGETIITHDGADFSIPFHLVRVANE